MRSRGRSHHVTRRATAAALLLAATGAGLLFAQAPPPRLEPTPIPSALYRSPKYRQTTATSGTCTNNADCNDTVACTADTCVGGECVHTPIEGCVPCRPTYECLPTELVFIVDTSGSMKDEAAALCTSIDHAVAELETLGVTVTPTIWGITTLPGGAFFCLTDTVVNRLGSTVPGNANACPFPDATSAFESWGPATAIVAGLFPWAANTSRIVVPISDEGPCNGSRPDGCNDPGDDRDSVINASNVAFNQGIVVSPIVGTGADGCVRTLANDLAIGTGGSVYFTQEAFTDLPTAIVNLVLQQCAADPTCDDGRDCTTDDVCVDGQCRGTLIPGCTSCVTPADCNDQDACTDDACVRFACEYTLNYDPETTCCGSFNGQRNPITDGIDCTQDLCNPFTGTVDHPLLPAGTSCGDQRLADCNLPNTCDESGNCLENIAAEGTPCGDPNDWECSRPDTCDGQGTCLPNHNEDGIPCEDGVFCTDPDRCSDGLCAGPERDCTEHDGPCQVGRCDENTAACTSDPLPEFSFCDDGDDCTQDDRCNTEGVCLGEDVNSLPCASHADCFGKYCNVDRGICFCTETPAIGLAAEAGSFPTPGCHLPGEEFQVDVTVGFSTAVVAAGQFHIQYDPQVLDLLSVSPGSAADPASPFSVEVFRSVNESLGAICYAVSTQAPGTGTQGPAIMATMRFRVLGGCASTDICFLGDDLCATTLTDVFGESVPFVASCSDTLATEAEPLSLTCPRSIDTTADAGEITASVLWTPPAAGGGCGRDVVLHCEMTDGVGVLPEDVLPGGGVFPPGSFSFRCTATDACGAFRACNWRVTVRPKNTAEIGVVQLSPIMAPQPITRCIEFAFYSSCIEPPVIVQESLEFGGLFNLVGFAGPVALEIPPGRYHCVTARDPLHTLRSVSDVTVVGVKYVAEFVDDPFFGGNWLIGGNLNSDPVIDILDFGIFVDQYSRHVDPDTPCGTIELNADINGDGVVNTLDYAFIVRNFDSADKGSCCPGSAASTPLPARAVTLPQLDEMGISHLGAADLNHDGVLNTDDMIAFEEGKRPTKPASLRRGTGR